MKDENDFNARLSRELRKLHPKTYHTKTSDRFSVGISDFLIWRGGKTLAIEIKFCKCLAEKNLVLLKHPFTGAQQTQLENHELVGNRAFGGVYINDSNQFVVIPRSLITQSGNWYTHDFKEKVMPICGVHKMWGGVQDFLQGVFCE